MMAAKGNHVVVIKTLLAANADCSAVDKVNFLCNTNFREF
jgi:hypothetical protein